MSERWYQSEVMVDEGTVPSAPKAVDIEIFSTPEGESHENIERNATFMCAHLCPASRVCAAGAAHAHHGCSLRR
jgi:hypothetical protein